MLRWSGHIAELRPDPEEAKTALALAERRAGQEIPGIDLDLDAMLALWESMAPDIAKAPFSDEKSSALRHWYNNGFYRHGDGKVYYGMLARFRPRRIIEIGCGFSTALALDTIEHLALDTKMTLIEPESARVQSLLRPNDRHRVELRQNIVQDVPPAFFADLGENDILFIDSSHILKTGSDVCYEFFEILPRLRQGVIVHVHDIGDQFEYPPNWVFKDKRPYTEAYLLRAFLMHNTAYKPIFFNNYFAARYPDKLKIEGVRGDRNEGGSLWMRREA